VPRVALLVIVLASAIARAAPDASQRVVLADPDPELRRAMQTALAPWKLEVIDEDVPPPDTMTAAQRAEESTARFVVWRDATELVVYDRDRGSAERRTTRAGLLDPPTAAAAALTIKTMMRLPPPPPPEEPAPPPPAAASGVELRLQAQIASRIARSDETMVSARYGGAFAIRPWPGAGLRLGIAADTGSATDVNRASFKGTWSDWAALGIVSWTFARGVWELEPQLGFGVRRSTLDGAETGTPRSETATLATARAGLVARWRLARFTVGATLAVDDVFGTPTYIKTIGAAEIFQVPGMGIEFGAVIAIDL
jgi:hypothetical protein